MAGAERGGSKEDLPDKLSPRNVLWEELPAEAETSRGLGRSPFNQSGTASQKSCTWSSSPSSMMRRRQPSMGEFIKAAPLPKRVSEVDNSWRGKAKRWATYAVEHNYTSNVLAVVVLFDAYFTAADIDARASDQQTSPFIRACSDICLVFYTVELPLLFIVRGRRILKDWMVVLDMVIIGCGYAEWMLTTVGDEWVSRINILRPLRLARIVRIMQVLRKTRSLKELQKLVTMLATCLKALAWSFLFCFVIMTVWAMLMVEIVNPLIQDIHATSEVFEACGEECIAAASSVMHANLLLFKTVIAGDSWGEIAVPVIKAYPLTAFIFMGSLLTLVFGVLNLIVAVVVDTFAEVRESDVVNLAEELEHNLKNDRKYLQKIFNRLDESGTGELTLQDLMDGARKDAEFQSRLRVMDIDEVDLQQLFEMIDADGSGAIEAAEFIAPLSRWVHDSKTAPRFIKYNLEQTMQTQEELLRLSQYSFAVLSQRMAELSGLIKGDGESAEEVDSQRAGETQMTTTLESVSQRESFAEHADKAEAVEAVLPDPPELPEGSVEQPHRSLSRNMQHRESTKPFSGPHVDKSLLPEPQGPGAAGVSLLQLEIAMKEAMLALEQSLSRATEGALQQSFAVAERVLLDHLGEPRSQSRGRSSSSSTAGRLSREEWVPDVTRSQKAARRKSVTNTLWTEF